VIPSLVRSLPQCSHSKAWEWPRIDFQDCVRFKPARGLSPCSQLGSESHCWCMFSRSTVTLNAWEWQRIDFHDCVCNKVGAAICMALLARPPGLFPCLGIGNLEGPLAKCISVYKGFKSLFPAGGGVPLLVYVQPQYSRSKCMGVAKDRFP
jgi:hypothetical protein